MKKRLGGTSDEDVEPPQKRARCDESLIDISSDEESDDERGDRRDIWLTSHSKWLLLSDVHIQGNGSKQEAAFQVLKLSQEYAKERGAGIIMLGDFWHTAHRRGQLSVEELNKVVDYLRKEWRTDCIMIPGNHDMCDARGSIHALTVLSCVCPQYIRVISEPTPVDDALFIPFAKDELKVRPMLQERRWSAVFCHVDFKGAQMSACRISKYGWDPESQSEVPIFTGHFHKPHRVESHPNICYVGSQWQVTAMEREQRKRFLVIEKDGEFWKECENIPVDVGRRHFLAKTIEELRNLNERTRDQERDVVEKPRNGDSVVYRLLRPQLTEEEQQHVEQLRELSITVRVENLPTVSNVEFDARRELTPSQTWEKYVESRRIDEDTKFMGLNMIRSVGDRAMDEEYGGAHVVLEKVTIEGYGPFQEEVQFSLDRKGLIQLRGINEDDKKWSNSNGAGKTSLLFAAFWALTGKTDPRPLGHKERTLTSSQCINSSGKCRDCCVTVTGKTNGLHFEVKRMAKGGTKIVINGEDRSKTNQENSKVVISREIFHLPEADDAHKVLSQSVFIGQQSTTCFLEGTDRDIKEFLSQGGRGGTVFWESLKKKCKVDMKQRQEEVIRLRERQRGIAQELDRLKTSLKSNQRKVNEDNKRREKELEDVQSKLNDVRQMCIDGHMSDIDAKIETLKKALEEEEKSKTSLSVTNDRLDDKESKVLEQLRLLESEMDLIYELDEKLLQLGNEKPSESIEEVMKEQEFNQRQIDAVFGEGDRLDDEISSNRDLVSGYVCELAKTESLKISTTLSNILQERMKLLVCKTPDAIRHIHERALSEGTHALCICPSQIKSKHWKGDALGHQNILQFDEDRRRGQECIGYAVNKLILDCDSLRENMRSTLWYPLFGDLLLFKTDDSLHKFVKQYGICGGVASLEGAYVDGSGVHHCGKLSYPASLFPVVSSGKAQGGEEMDLKLRETNLKNIVQKIENFREGLTEIRDAMDNICILFTGGREELQEIPRNSSTDVTDSERIDRLQKVLTKCNKFIQERKQTENDDVKNIRKSKKGNASSLKSCENRLRKLREEIDKCTRRQAELECPGMEQELEEQLTKINQRENPFEQQVKEDENGIHDKQEEMENTEKKLQEAIKESDILKSLVGNFDKKGIQHFVLQNSATELEGFVNFFLHRFQKGGNPLLSMRLDIKNQGNIEAKVDDKGETRSLAQLSGGQRQRMRIAMILGASAYVKLRTVVTCPMIVLDEIFQHLDDCGQKRVQELLRDVCDNSDPLKVETIFIVTHENVFGDECDEVCTVKLSNGNATVL